MKQWREETWIVMLLLVIVIYEMTLLAIGVLLEHIPLEHAASEKEVMLFIIGVAAGYLGGRKTNT